MSATIRRLLHAAAIVLICAAPAHAQAIYHLTDLGTLGGANSDALGINASGQIVGWSDTTNGQAAFLYSGGVMKNLGTLGGSQSTATGINAAGQIVGNSLISGDATSHAFIYSGSAMSDLTTSTAGAFTVANGINAGGLISGGNSAGHAAVYNAGNVADLGTLGGSTSVATSINSAGQVAGWSATSSSSGGDGQTHAFLYGSGMMTDLSPFANNPSKGLAINSVGEIAGSTSFSSDTVPFTANVNYPDFFSGLGGNSAEADGINDSGLVVGKSTTTQNPSDNSYRAFLISGPTTLNLNNLVDSSASGWTLVEANSINNSRSIVGAAVNSAGATHAVLLTMLPPPTFNWSNAGTTGIWNTPANWSPAGSPNAARSIAIFGSTSPTGTVTLHGNQTVGALQFNNGSSGSGITITAGDPSATLTIDSGLPGDTPTINVTAGQHTIATPVVLDEPLNINISTTAPGTGLTISGPISGSQYPGITLAGGGTLTFSGANTYTNPTTISAGTLRAGAVNTLSPQSPVTVAAGATLVLGGFSQTAPQLDGAGSVTNNASVPATLTVGGEFSGTISDSTGSSASAGKLSVSLHGMGAALTLSGVNTYTGVTAANGGQLTLDFSNLSMPTNIINASSALVLGGGALSVIDAAGATATLQTFNGTIINPTLDSPAQYIVQPGFSTIAVTTNGNTNPASALVLGALTHTSGATLAFALPSIGNITTTMPNTNRIIGPWALVGISDWAANSGVPNAAGGNNIVAYSGYTYDYTSAAATTPTTNFGWSPGNNTSTINTVDATDAIAPGSTTNSLRFNTASDCTIVLTGANTIASGGILVTPATISPRFPRQIITGDGTLTVGSVANELLVITNGGYSSQARLTIETAILDTGSGSTALTVSGSGILTLTNAGNTFGGITRVNNTATLQISDDHALGAVPTSTRPGSIILNGGTLQVSGNVTLSPNRGIAIGPGGYYGGEGTIDASGGSLTYDGIIADNGPGPYALTVAGGSVLLGGANTYSGGTMIWSESIAPFTLSITSDAALGGTNADPNISFYGGPGTLRLAPGFTGTLSSARNITIYANGNGTIDTSGAAIPIVYSGEFRVGGTIR